MDNLVGNEMECGQVWLNSVRKGKSCKYCIVWRQHGRHSHTGRL